VKPVFFQADASNFLDFFQESDSVYMTGFIAECTDVFQYGFEFIQADAEGLAETKANLLPFKVDKT